MARKQFGDLRDTALEALDYLEEKRIGGDWTEDGDIRIIEAAIAHYVGFETRSSWCEILDEDHDSRRVKAKAQQDAKSTRKTF